MIGIGLLQVVSAGDLLRDAIVRSGALDVAAVTFLVCALAVGWRTTSRAILFACFGRWAARPKGPADCVAWARALRLAERTWLALGLVALLVPWISNVAQIRGGIEDPSRYGAMSLASPNFLLVLVNVAIARLLLGGKARGLMHRAVKATDGGLTEGLRRDATGDVLVLAHLAIPPLWIPLLFFRFPV